MKVRYYGHVGEPTGYGVAAREMCRALLMADVELEIRPLEPRVNLATLDDESRLPLAPYLRTDRDLTAPDAVIVHTMPSDCIRVMSIVEAEHPGDPALDRPWVAYTTWEAMSAPDGIREDLSIFDQVWTPSSFSLHSIANHITLDTNQWAIEIQEAGVVPVHVMPHAYDPVTPFDTERAEASSPYRFLYVGAWTARKNPSGLLRAFAHANFGPGEAELWIQSTGTPGAAFAAAHVQTGCHETMAPVRFYNEPRSAIEMRELYARADCFVTASRGEAWNLPAFEAMLHKRQIIAPTPAGSDEFLFGTTATRILGGMMMPAAVDVRAGRTEGQGFGMTVVGAHGLSARSLWWEPDLVELAAAMVEVARDKRRDLFSQYDPAERFGYAAVGKLALKHLEDLST